MLDKLTKQDRQISRNTYNGMVDAANSFSNMGMGCGDMNMVGNPSFVPQEQPEPGCWARVTAIVTDTYGNFLRDAYCRLQYDWIEQERYSTDGVSVFWRDKVQFPRHSIPLDNGSQHPLREINGKPLVVGRRYWIYPGMLLFNGPEPTATGSNWEHLTVASPQKTIRVKTNEDWYACGCITGTQQTINRCGTSAQSCPPVGSCPSCESCSACDSCPDTSCESCSCPSAESGFSDSSGSGGSSGDVVPSGVTTVCLGVTPCGSCPADDIHSPQITCDNPIYLADPLGTISEANLYAIQDVNGTYFVPAGTYVYVEHLDDAYTEDGDPLYEPTGGWGQGCACTAVPCPTASCVTCPSCGTSCSCPGSCPSCGSCTSESSSSQSASYSTPQDPRKCPNGAEAGWQTDAAGNCYWGCPACSGSGSSSSGSSSSGSSGSGP